MNGVAENGKDLLKIYEIHVEMADRVSRRRDGANRLFLAILSAMTALAAAVLRFAPDSGALSAKIAVVIVASAGLSLAAAWLVVINSYRQLNDGKFQALHELEKSLPFAFYTVEWKKLQQGKNYRVYWELTVVETLLPCIFFVLFLAIALLALAS